MKRGHLWALVPESERENSPVGLLFDLDDFMVRYNLINLLHHSCFSSFILLLSLTFYLWDSHFILGESKLFL